MFDIIEKTQSKDSFILGTDEKRKEWLIDFEALIVLDKLPLPWEDMLPTHLEYKLPSGKTLKQFILSTYDNYQLICSRFLGRGGAPRYHWYYCSWRHLVNLFNTRMYTNVNDKETAVILSFVQK